jgi:hypothetical protein
LSTPPNLEINRKAEVEKIVGNFKKMDFINPQELNEYLEKLVPDEKERKEIILNLVGKEKVENGGGTEPEGKGKEKVDLKKKKKKGGDGEKTEPEGKGKEKEESKEKAQPKEKEKAEEGEKEERKEKKAKPKKDSEKARKKEALLHSAAEGDNPEALKSLLKYPGVNVDVRDSEDRTPLMIAAKNGNALNVQALMEAGADLNSMNKMGWTALNYAIRLGNRDAVKLILDQEGISLDHQTLTTKKTPLMAALDQAKYNPRQYEIAEDLIKAGASLGDKIEGGTVLHYFIEKQDKKAIEFLLKQKDFKISPDSLEKLVQQDSIFLRGFYLPLLKGRPELNTRIGNNSFINIIEGKGPETTAPREKEDDLEKKRLSKSGEVNEGARVNFPTARSYPPLTPPVVPVNGTPASLRVDGRGPSHGAPQPQKTPAGGPPTSSTAPKSDLSSSNKGKELQSKIDKIDKMKIKRMENINLFGKQKLIDSNKVSLKRT